MLRSPTSLALAALAALAGCQSRPATRPGVPPATAPAADVLIEGVPHITQEPDFCGEACVAMWMAKLGHPVTQDQVFDLTGVDPALGRGAYTVELKRALEALGFDVGPVWHKIDAAGAAAALEVAWRALHADLLAGVPSIVCMHYSDAADAPEHFRLVLGYDAGRDEVIYQEPAEASGAYRRMPRSAFLAMWPLKYEQDSYTLIRFRLAVGTLAPPAASAGVDDAAYAQHVLALRASMPEGFTLLLERPFVVLGDEPEADVREHAERTVRWAVRMLRQDFFAVDPPKIIDVWLFRDDHSYYGHAKSIFGDTPDTPYGYASATHDALIMNIGTGGGTLVHEIVHPYMAANVPDPPPWLNEGLASLFEQCGEEGGHIHGYTNWRLAGLKDDLRAGTTLPFVDLTALDDAAFYGEGSGSHYAEARYLLYYLQEKGLLLDFFRRYLAARKDDPTGYQTLVAVLGEKDMVAFELAWGKWALALKYPER